MSKSITIALSLIVFTSVPSFANSTTVGDITQEPEIRRLGRWARPRLTLNATHGRHASFKVRQFLAMSDRSPLTCKSAGRDFDFGAESHSILSGGKPAFPTCEFSSLEWSSQSLEKRVAAEAAQFKGKVSLFAKNLDTGATFSFQGDEPVQTASTIKVAVMIEAFARVAEGKAKWSDELILTKDKKAGGSGILFEFSDGHRLTLRDATTLMMILSDNTATNLVIDTFGADAVNARMESLGMKETRLMRRVFGGGESAEGKKPESKRFGLGRTSAREMVTLVEKLERGEIISASASKEMIDLMKREQGTHGIWRHQWRVPKATKSGALDALRSNVGIIYHPRGRIALAITAHEIPEVSWTVDNPALLLMNRLSEIVVEELGAPVKQTVSLR